MHNIAVIGYGGMGEWHCNSIKKEISKLNIKGVYDIRPERNNAARSNGLFTYDSLESVLNDKDIDIVTIATPNDSHKKLAIDMLKAGKNVVLEKPAAMSAKDFNDIVAVSEETGKILTTHQNRRWDKDYNIIKSIYQNNLIGNIYSIESRIQGSRQFLHGWRSAAFNGGGMVYDWGVHIIDQALDLIDSKVVSVYAHLFHVFTDEVDDNFKVMLRFEDGTSVILEASMNCFVLHPRWHISGENGTAVINDWDCNGKIVLLADEKNVPWEEKIVYTSAGPTRSMAPRPSETVTELSLPVVSPHWSDFYNNVISAIEGKEQLIVKPSETIRVLSVMDSIFASAKAGKSIECEI